MAVTHLPARATDPLTSWEAAEKITDSGKAADQRAVAVSIVHKHPGLTSFELSMLCPLDRYQMARRLPECREVQKGEARECKVTGHMAVTWWPAVAQAEPVAA